jgi:hypothetical protein
MHGVGIVTHRSPRPPRPPLPADHDHDFWVEHLALVVDRFIIDDTVRERLDGKCFLELTDDDFAALMRSWQDDSPHHEPSPCTRRPTR